MYLRALAVAVCVFLPACTVGLGCKDDGGSDVDWWVAFKLPKGGKYVYADSNAPSALVSSSYDMNDVSSGALAQTLGQIYGSRSGRAAAFWNDENPEVFEEDARARRAQITLETTRTFGHTKGVLAFDANEGFQLTHSAPKFPWTNVSKYSGLPTGQQVYGQSFLCVTYSGLATFNSIAEILQYNAADIYTSWVDSSLSKSVPAFVSFIGGTYVTTATCKTRIVQSRGGAQMSHFTKSNTWGKDLYGDLVSQALGDGLLVETWIRGDEEGPFCPPKYEYPTLDVESVTLAGTTFKETQDHSKWAVTSGDTQKFVCIGDINRMTSQYARGGGTVCIPSDELWQAVFNTVTTSDQC